MALWEERIAAAALEQDGEAPLADDSDPEEEPRTDDGPEPEATRFLSLEELVGTTVGAVMEEHHETLLKPKWGLFSRKRQEETEQLYESMEAPEESVKPLTEAESIGEEPELSEVASEEREAYKSRHRSLGFAYRRYGGGAVRRHGPLLDRRPADPRRCHAGLSADRIGAVLARAGVRDPEAE